jgi:RES domain
LPKFPNPPPVERLVELGADERAVPAGAALFRIYFRGGEHPGTWNGFRFFGPVPSGRFDHHLGPPRVQERGTLYVAWHPRTCLAEVFQAKRRIDLASRSPLLVGFELARSLRLLDLTALWPTRAAASMAISSGPRIRAQAWARRIYEAYPWLDGVYYGSSMDGNAPCAALSERAMEALPPLPRLHRALSDPLLRSMLQRAALQLNYDLF